MKSPGICDQQIKGDLFKKTVHLKTSTTGLCRWHNSFHSAFLCFSKCFNHPLTHNNIHLKNIMLIYLPQNESDSKSNIKKSEVTRQQDL
jgi:hypothetical protein